MEDILLMLFSYPVVIPFTGFIICTVILLLSAITIGIDNDFEIPTDIFGIENPIVTAGLSKVPLFIGLAVTFLPMTIINILLDQTIYSIIKEIPVLGSIAFLILSILMLLITFVLSLYIAGYILKPLENAIESSKLSVTYEFQEGIVISNGITEEYGEVKVIINNLSHLLSAILENKEDIVEYGDKIIILRKDELKDKYIVRKI